ncbi:hypothetical protein [Hyphomicrobium sp. CS1BSMeth3]|uniref:hypothetical protein n=1 Tax=Hyphomicrobium sp. CS1BSMeth3 TaxID=1892844 RepID=UPI0015761EF7|nr:hypothetical protein [Hyphomicrobium sp. CS1BSMeth3]
MESDELVMHDEIAAVAAIAHQPEPIGVSPGAGQRRGPPAFVPTAPSILIIILHYGIYL